MNNNVSFEKTIKNYYSNPVKVSDFNNNQYIDEIADPTIIRDEKGDFYIISTQGKMFKSKNGCDFTLINENIIPLPTWGTEVGAKDNDYGLWAPDLKKIGDKWIMYYSLSGWGSPRGIGCAISDNIEGPYKDLGKMFSCEEIGIENCIDPQVIIDDDKIYMVAGSFRGIYLFQLDETGTKLLNGAKAQNKEKVLIAGKVGKWDGSTYEGSYIIKKDNQYYYFGSVGTCCEGQNSTYHVIVGKSNNIFGPYTGKDNISLTKSGNGITYGEIVVSVPTSKNDIYAGVGHNSILLDEEGNYYIYYHGYSKLDNFKTRHLFMDKLLWDEEGYPYVENYRPSFEEQKEGPTFIFHERRKI